MKLEGHLKTIMKKKMKKTYSFYGVVEAALQLCRSLELLHRPYSLRESRESKNAYHHELKELTDSQTRGQSRTPSARSR